MKIPDELWRCPKCGVGYMDGEGLIYDPDDVEDDVADDEYDPEGTCVCQQCNWIGSAREVLAAALRRSRRKPCPHGGGTGWVEAPKGDEPNGSANRDGP